MREFLYYFTFEEAQFVSMGMYLFAGIIILLMLIFMIKRIALLNMLFVPIIFFSILLGYFFQEMPKNLLLEIEKGYNISTSDIENKNPARHKIISIQIKKSDILVAEYSKGFECAHKNPGNKDWLSTKTCITKVTNQKYDCNLLDVNACVATIYEKYLY